MLWQLVRSCAAPYRRWVAIVLVLQLASTIASLYLPSLNAQIIDDGVAKGDLDTIWRLGAWMLTVTFVQVICSIVAVYYGARTAMSIGRDLRQDLFEKVGSFADREVQAFTPASLITRNTNDVTQVQTLALMVLTIFVMAPIMCIGGIVMALHEDSGLAWLLLVSVPLLVICIALIVVRMVPSFRRVQTGIDNINRILREQITGIRVVRAFVREPEENARFASANDELARYSLRASRLMARMFPTVMLILNVSSVAILWFGGHRVDDGDGQIGSLVAFLSYLVQILMSVMMATFVATMIPRASVSAERITEVFDTESSVKPPLAPAPAPERLADVEFRHVSFKYPGADEAVLADVSFTAVRGGTTAIIGSTGAGKTTLISLIPRLFDVTAGAVFVDGVDVRDYEPDELWSRIGLVPQKSYLFSGTVASNLRFGNPGASDDQLWRALEVAQAREFVAQLPGDLQGPISQGGTNLSGGQRQRLAIARALVAEPEIFIFDDSFSALDVATDARLRSALHNSTGSATVIIVAQRVSTIAEADRIVVVDSGRVEAIGRHDELFASSATYREIVESQLSVAAR